jgi:hypothetical protein
MVRGGSSPIEGPDKGVAADEHCTVVRWVIASQRDAVFVAELGRETAYRLSHPRNSEAQWQKA